jgi:uncharacterized protein YfaT (DUF1175 family)
MTHWASILRVGLLGFVLTGALALAAPPSSLADLDEDGYPDIAEFHSSAQREAFLEWFAAIAEAQFTAPSPAWLPQEQDCAGLLRFAFRSYAVDRVFFNALGG